MDVRGQQKRKARWATRATPKLGHAVPSFQFSCLVTYDSSSLPNVRLKKNQLADMADVMEVPLYDVVGLLQYPTLEHVCMDVVFS